MKIIKTFSVFNLKCYVARYDIFKFENKIKEISYYFVVIKY